MAAACLQGAREESHSPGPPCGAQVPGPVVGSMGCVSLSPTPNPDTSTEGAVPLSTHVPWEGEPGGC